ncbi:hypothetical protein STAS_29273 [Striga asiatica]|uniref:Uncharacterized protein n=1 Tax=Striga asiatica TaxID=4170 RepID=A0A5A7R2E4_STRAF|nr:hypothetical protein STAS_29273 [Striga asiatica]
MASESSTGFHQHHRRGMSAGVVVSAGCELIPTGSYMIPRGAMGLGGNNGSGGEIIFSSQNSSCATSFLVDSVPGLKHDTGLATEWSIDEQYTLEEGLARCAREPNILRYIKIAATLRNKTVRDVALRCRWMTGKRRKLEDMRFGIREKDLKEKIELSLKNAMSSASSVKVAPYSLTANHHDPSKYILSGGIHFMANNFVHAFQCSVGKQGIFWRKITRLLIKFLPILRLLSMRNMPGVMSQMPPLPVLLDVQLANSILPLSSQVSSLILSLTERCFISPERV